MSVVLLFLGLRHRQNNIPRRGDRNHISIGSHRVRFVIGKPILTPLITEQKSGSHPRGTAGMKKKHRRHVGQKLFHIDSVSPYELVVFAGSDKRNQWNGYET